MAPRSVREWLGPVLLLVACRNAEHADVPLAPTTAEPTTAHTAMPAPAPTVPPQAASADAQPKLVVSITLDGIVLVGARQAHDDDAIVAAARERSADPSTRIYIDSDDRVDFYRAVRVIDLMKQGGIDKFAFIVRNAGKGEILPLDLPRAKDIMPRVEGDSFEEVPIIGVEARADGSAVVDGRPMRHDAIPPHVRSVLSKNSKARAVLRANRGATYGHVTTLYRLLREGGASNPALGVELAP